MIYEIRTYNLKVGQLQEYWERLRRETTGASGIIKTWWALVH